MKSSWRSGSLISLFSLFVVLLWTRVSLVNPDPLVGVALPVLQVQLHWTQLVVVMLVRDSSWMGPAVLGDRRRCRRCCLKQPELQKPPCGGPGPGTGTGTGPGLGLAWALERLLEMPRSASPVLLSSLPPLLSLT